MTCWNLQKKLLAILAIWCSMLAVGYGGGSDEKTVAITGEFGVGSSNNDSGGESNDNDSGGVISGTAMLSWTPPTTNADGSALEDLAGYKIYFGTFPGNYSNTIDIDNPGIATYVIDNLSPCIYYFVVTAYDESNNESNNSNVATKTLGFGQCSLGNSSNVNVTDLNQLTMSQTLSKLASEFISTATMFLRMFLNRM